MEIVMALLFLIGALTLGSNASTFEENRTDEHGAARTEQTAIGQGEDGARGPCRFAGGRLVQRDLTVPPVSAEPVFSETIEKAGLGCSDE